MQLLIYAAGVASGIFIMAMFIGIRQKEVNHDPATTTVDSASVGDVSVLDPRHVRTAQEGDAE